MEFGFGVKESAGYGPMRNHGHTFGVTLFRIGIIFQVKLMAFPRFGISELLLTSSGNHFTHSEMEPPVRFELTTVRLQGECSTN